MSSGSRGAIAQQAAQHADGGEQRHGQQLAMQHGRDGNQNSRNQAAHVAAQDSGEQAAFESQIYGLIGRDDSTRVTTPAANTPENHRANCNR